MSSNGKPGGRPPAEDNMFTFQYSFRNEKGIDVHICQKEVCDVHGFGPKRLQILRRELVTGALEHDRRG